MFKERRTRFTLLSLLSALVVVSTAFVGVSIYAQTDDSELTTFEEEAIDAGAGEDEAGLEDDETSVASDGPVTSDADDSDNATDDGSTEIADVASLFAGLPFCNVGTTVISNETQVAAAPDEGTTPTVSVEVMSETELAELASNETETASAGNETSIASAECVLVGGGGNDTSSGNATDTAADAAGSNVTLADNMTSTENATNADNATSTANTTSTASLGDDTTTANAPESDREIMVIEGQDFAPGQVVLIFSENALIGIDDVDTDGNIETKIPVPAGSETTVAGNDSGGTTLEFVESGTGRTATFEFDGETLTASAGGDIEAADAAGEDLQAAPSSNTTSSNTTSTSNSISSKYTMQ